MFFFQEAGHPHDRGALHSNSTWEIFSDPQLDIFLDELHLGVDKMHAISGLVPKKCNAKRISSIGNINGRLRL